MTLTPSALAFRAPPRSARAPRTERRPTTARMTIVHRPTERLPCRLRAVGLRDASLEITNDPAQDPRREEPRPKGAGPILADGREQSQGGSGRRGHVIKLPADLVGHSICPVGRGQASRLRGVCGGPQGVRAHVGHGGGLPGRSSGRSSSGTAHLASRTTVLESVADFLGDVELTASESPRPDDRIARAAVLRSLRLEQSQHPLRAVRRPRRDDPPVSLAQRLRGTHTQILPHAPSAGARLPIGLRDTSSVATRASLSADQRPCLARTGGTSPATRPTSTSPRRRRTRRWRTGGDSPPRVKHSLSYGGGTQRWSGRDARVRSDSLCRCRLL
jgi:hypothetical protein